MEKEMEGLNVETSTTDANGTNVENNGTVENEQQSTENNNAQKTFTQDQVNDFIKKRIERERQTIYGRYGVKDRNSLDALMNKANSYSMMEERYNNMVNESANLKEELCLLKGNVNTERYDDVRAYFKGKGLDFNENNLKAELERHPEWLNVTPKTTTISVLGSDNGHINAGVNERDEALRLFGLKK